MTNAIFHVFMRLLLCLLTSLAVEAKIDTHLCQKDEKPLFSCKAKDKLFSVCSSNDLSTTNGYLQYRVSKNGRVELEFPPEKKHPKGIFQFTLLPRGGSLDFSNGGFEYNLYSNVDGMTNLISVTKGGKAVSKIKCKGSLDGIDLTMTPIQKLLESVGLGK